MLRLRTATRRTNQKLDVLLGKLNNQSNEVKSRAEKIIELMIEHNDNLDPDTLARAALFVSKKSTSQLSKEEVDKIMDNGKRKKNSWIDLIPIIERIT